MNGAHDLGGMDGFPPIERNDEGHFPDEWERSVFALTLAAGFLGRWNLDQSRFAREQMEPAHYLASSYYEHWLHGLEILLVQSGLVSEQELESGTADSAAQMTPIARCRVAAILARGAPTTMPADSAPIYGVGDRIRTRNSHPRGHTRLPRYLRGRVGRIEHYHGAHVFPDTHALNGSKQPAHLYGIVFACRELWGAERGDARDSIRVDVFEPYIESVLQAADPK